MPRFERTNQHSKINRSNLPQNKDLLPQIINVRNIKNIQNRRKITISFPSFPYTRITQTHNKLKLNGEESHHDYKIKSFFLLFIPEFACVFRFPKKTAINFY